VSTVEFKLTVGHGKRGCSATFEGPDGYVAMAVGSSAGECARDVLEEAAEDVPNLVTEMIDGDVPERAS
jgi:hypothetical protein